MASIGVLEIAVSHIEVTIWKIGWHLIHLEFAMGAKSVLQRFLRGKIMHGQNTCIVNMSSDFWSTAS